MLWLSYATITLYAVVSETVVYATGIQLDNAGVILEQPGVNENLDKIQSMEIEMMELKNMFQATGQEMNEEIAKMKANALYHKNKMKSMQEEMDNLKETVISQSKMITEIKDLKAKHESELKAIIIQQKQKLEKVTLTIEKLEKKVAGMEKMNDNHLNLPTIKTKENMVDNEYQLTVSKTLQNNIDKMNNEKNISKDPLPFHNNSHAMIGERSVKGIKRQSLEPGNVSFSAYLSKPISHLAIGHTVKCDQIIINDGNAYSQYTGVFLVPQTGVYLLTFTFDVYDNNRYEGIKLVVDNRNIVDAIAEGISNKHAMGGNTVIIRLNENEHVWLESYLSNDAIRFDVYNTSSRYEGIKLVVDNRNKVDAIAEGISNKHAMGGNTVIIRLNENEHVWLESYLSNDAIRFDVYDTSNRYEGIKLVVDNRNIVDAIAEGISSKHAMGGNTVIIRLNENEHVWLESYYSNDDHPL